MTCPQLYVTYRTPITVSDFGEFIGGYYWNRYRYNFTVTLSDGSKRTFEGVKNSARDARNAAIRLSGRLIDKGIE